MARNIKIELELPEFEKELNISVTLTKDGEGLKCSSHPSGVKTNVSENVFSNPAPTTATSRELPQQWTQAKEVIPTPPSTPAGGNMMNMNFKNESWKQQQLMMFTTIISVSPTKFHIMW